jgi:hypothetical protein
MSLERITVGVKSLKYGKRLTIFASEFRYFQKREANINVQRHAFGGCSESEIDLFYLFALLN